MVDYEEGIRVVKKGFIILGALTVGEVGIALLGNGHIIPGFYMPKWLMYPAMISLSLYKAYYIVYNFMHMAYEVRGLALSVIGPLLLLVWGVIAFMQEGGSWRHNRELIIEKNEKVVKPAVNTQGMLKTHKQVRGQYSF